MRGRTTAGFATRHMLVETIHLNRGMSPQSRLTSRNALQLIGSEISQLHNHGRNTPEALAEYVGDFASIEFPMSRSGYVH